MRDKIIKKSTPGATSLLITLGVGMLLVTIISGIAALSLREQRQATNVDQSNRALQTAEAGVKAVVSKLATDPNYAENNCPVNEQIFPDQAEQRLTCKVVASKLSGLEGLLEQDRAIQVQAINTSGLGNDSARYMQLRWHNKKLDKVNPPYSFGGNFYPKTDTNYQSAAAIEITLIYWKRGDIGASFLGSEGLRIATTFFMPGNPDKANSAITSGCDDQATVNTTNLGDYHCETAPQNSYGFDFKDLTKVSDDPATYDYVVRVKPRYADTHFFMQFFNSSQTPINVQSTNAHIDITARSGNLYRRIKAEKPVIPTSLESLFDSVLYAGRGSNDLTNKNICKDLVVKDDFTLYKPNTPACEN